MTPTAVVQPSDVTHRLVPTPAGRAHVAELGAGPLVLLLHGFPESWYSWRRQLPALAAAGYRAAAVDVRGYGRSSRPADIAAYGLRSLAEDNVAIVRALGEESAVVVGHDWGSPIATHSGLLHPDVFRAVGLLSVPYSPPGGPRPSDVFARMREDSGPGSDEFYVSYFQQPGRAESEIEPDVRGWLAGIYAALSAETMPPPDGPHPLFVREGGTIRERLPHNRLPSWLTEAELDYYAGEFERTGFGGALARYRNMDRDWEDLADLNGEAITQPSLFLGGALDSSTTWMGRAIEAHAHTLPGLHPASRLLDGCGHWIQQERPEEVNETLIQWLGDLDHPTRPR